MADDTYEGSRRNRRARFREYVKRERAVTPLLEADALASVALDAGDTRVEPDYKAAVRALADQLFSAKPWVPVDSSLWDAIGDCMEKHAPAIAAARSET